MFTKSLIIFGLLAVFACQGTTASAEHPTELERTAIGDLIEKIRNIIKTLTDMVGGTLGSALTILKNLLSSVLQIKEKFLEDGIHLIHSGVGNVLEFVANKTSEALKLGVDISKCIIGTNQTLIDLTEGFTKNLTGCITTVVGDVLDTINKEIKNIDDIVKTILRAPVDLSKCIISLRPISCLTKLVNNLGKMALELPGQIVQIVHDAEELVKNLPTHLLQCIGNIGVSVTDKTEAIIKEIGDCADDIISKATTAAPSVTPSQTTSAGEVTSSATTSAGELSSSATTSAGEGSSSATTSAGEISSSATTSAGEVTPTPTAGPEATPSVNAVFLRASLGDLIDQVKNIIKNLTNLVNGVIGDAFGVLGNLINTIKEIKEKYLDDGIALITGEIGRVLDFIKTEVEEAAALGIDISKCILGRQEQVEELSTGLVFNLTDCITTTVTKVLQMVNNDLVTINKIVQDVTNAPLKLAKCLISLRPITCVTNLLSDLANLLTTIPSQVKEIVDNALELVATLPPKLVGCIGNIGKEATAQSDRIIKEIGDCVDAITSGTSNNL